MGEYLFLSQENIPKESFDNLFLFVLENNRVDWKFIRTTDRHFQQHLFIGWIFDFFILLDFHLLNKDESCSSFSASYFNHFMFHQLHELLLSPAECIHSDGQQPFHTSHR